MAVVGWHVCVCVWLGVGAGWGWGGGWLESCSCRGTPFPGVCFAIKLQPRQGVPQAGP